MTAGTDEVPLLDRLERLFARQGAQAYAGEAVSVAEHMLQCAALAVRDGAPDTLVAAALLHDVGHLVGRRGEYVMTDTADRDHHESGAAFLAVHFPPAVVEPVRLHVAAKRYLCAVDASYAAMLSRASRHTLALQGGPMGAPEAASFRREPFALDAIAVRRWDDAGKIEDMPIPGFGAFRLMLEAVVKGRTPS